MLKRIYANNYRCLPHPLKLGLKWSPFMLI
jgi:hypothetical protein